MPVQQAGKITIVAVLLGACCLFPARTLLAQSSAPVPSVTGDASMDTLEQKLKGDVQKQKAAADKKCAEVSAERAKKIAADAVQQWIASDKAAEKTLAFRNSCTKTIFVAIAYQPVGDAEWHAKGWYKAAAGEIVRPAMYTKNLHTYYYAKSDDGQTVWAGTGGGDDVFEKIDDGNAFSIGQTTQTPGLASRSFRHYVANLPGENLVNLTCN